MMFNIISYEKKVEESVLIISNKSISTLPGNILEHCKNNVTCLKDNVFEYSITQNNISLCTVFIEEKEINSCYENFFLSIQDIKPYFCSNYKNNSKEFCQSLSIDVIFENQTINQTCSSFQTNEDKIECHESYIIENVLYEKPREIDCYVFFNNNRFDDCSKIKEEYENREIGIYSRYCSSLKDSFMKNTCERKNKEVIIY